MSEIQVVKRDGISEPLDLEKMQSSNVCVSRYRRR